MSRLFEKYFPVAEALEDENEKQRATDTLERLASLVASVGWPLLRDKVGLMVTESAMGIQTGSEEDMRDQIWRKNGLMEVHALLLRIEREVTQGGP